MRIEPSHAILTATRRWLQPVREALGSEFLAAYVTGSALNQGFDERRSRVNVLLVARSLNLDVLDAVREKLPEDRKVPHFHPLFVTQRQIYPDAAVKIYLDADLDARARRRARELEQRGIPVALEDVRAELARRDERDRGRAESPLVIPAGARVVNTSSLTIEEQIEEVLRAVRAYPDFPGGAGREGLGRDVRPEADPGSTRPTLPEDKVS